MTKKEPKIQEKKDKKLELKKVKLKKEVSKPKEIKVKEIKEETGLESEVISSDSVINSARIAPVVFDTESLMLKSEVPASGIEETVRGAVVNKEEEKIDSVYDSAYQKSDTKLYEDDRNRAIETSNINLTSGPIIRPEFSGLRSGGMIRPDEWGHKESENKTYELARQEDLAEKDALHSMGQQGRSEDLRKYRRQQ